MQQVGFPRSVRDTIRQARRPAVRNSSNAVEPRPPQDVISASRAALAPIMRATVQPVESRLAPR